MGSSLSLLSRGGGGGRAGSAARPADTDIEQQVAYSNCVGSFFGAHFLMGGERYDLSKPEAFLFGENSDLDLLGNKPVPFPYHRPSHQRHSGTDSVKPLHLAVNIRKETLKFIKVKSEEPASSGDEKEEEEEQSEKYRLEFLFDADEPCTVQVHFFAREQYVDGAPTIVYKSQSRPLCSERFEFEAGADILFDKYTFDPAQFNTDELRFSGGLFFPVLIAVETIDPAPPQMQTTLCTVEVSTDGGKTYVIKPLRQKIAADGVVYLLQEIFGIENKSSENALDENGYECIICMSEVRDTVILPCRHMCICNGCAETLRYKLNNCPICRSPFRALIQMKGVRIVNCWLPANQNSKERTHTRYETLNLVEGLNGAIAHMHEGSPHSARRADSVRVQQVSLQLESPVVVDPVDGREESGEIEMQDFFVHRGGDDTASDDESGPAQCKPRYSRVEVLSDPPSEDNSQHSGRELLADHQPE